MRKIRSTRSAELNSPERFGATKADLGEPRRARGSAFLATLCLGALLLAAPAKVQAQIIDLNTNGMSDVWENIYGASALVPSGDADGDKASNQQEALAGTNPFDSTSAPRIALGALAGTNFTITVNSQLGKQYVLQSVQPLGPGGWTNWTFESTVVAREGTTVTLNALAGSSPKFFRIAISDLDSDGDGVNDWEEYQLGLDPFNPTSNGHLDSNGVPIGDYAYVTGQIVSQNVVSIVGTDAYANQPDAGQQPTDLGLLNVVRGGFPLNSITVSVSTPGSGPGIAVSGVDYDPLPALVSLPAGVSSTPIYVRPRANANRLAPVVATVNVQPGAGYSVGTPNSSSVTINPSATPTGTGLTGYYYTNANATYANSANFNAANLKMTRLDPTVDYTWGTTSLPIVNNGYYSIRWLGQVQPQYSETYFFVANTDDGVKLWVNDQLIIDSWAGKSASDLTASIKLQGGTRYNIKMEYFQLTGSAVAHLSWYSASQPKQIIPSNRLYPTNTTASSAIISSTTAVGFLGQPFSYTVVGANTPLKYSASPVPPGLTFNTSSGLLSGIPSAAGNYQVMLTTSNSVGLSASILYVQIFDTGSAVTRELWSGVPGTNIADIPLSTPANVTNFIGTLEGTTDFGDNYAERIRGYLTAPTTGNYYFWIAGSDSAELWISNDGEPANKVRRSYVSPANPSGSRQWTVASSQRSGWLTMVAGQRYYLEILHKAGVGAGDNWSVGWLQDPTGTNNNVSAVVPGYLLSKYFALPPSLAPGTLYAANLVTAPNVLNMGSGSATLRLSADSTRAILNFGFSGVPSGVISEHIVNDPYLNKPSEILFDISAARPQPDGSYTWPITPVGSYSAADVVQILNEGKAYLTILTEDYPNGELNGHFAAVQGSQSFTPPPAAPSWTDDHTSTNAATRFLIQATYGPTLSDISAVQTFGYDGWLSNQFSLAASHLLTNVSANISQDPSTPYPSTTLYNTWWEQAVSAPDQLRQRVAFALSEIMVASQNGVLADNGRALAYYYDTLSDNAFGNFRDVLEAVTLTPAMGLYLDMRGNPKGSIITGVHANENYAREIMQLFSVGLYRLWPDGTLVLNSQGSLVPTYDQNVINGFAQVFTGWNYWQPNQTNGHLPTSFSPAANYTNPMVLVPTQHDLNTKLLLDNVMLPQAWGTQTVTTNSSFDSYCLQDLESALDSIFNNQNVGPYVCRQLIQRLVTSSPSPGYLYRVVSKFNNNGSGVRGDMQAVVRAILLDYEARSPAMLTVPTYGKQREPVLRVTAPARAFLPPPVQIASYSQSGDRIIAISNATPHRLNSTGDTLFLSFTEATGNPEPEMKSYTVATIINSNVFTVAASGISSGTYTQAINMLVTNTIGGTSNVYTTNIITALMGSAHGLAVGNYVYLQVTNFPSLSGVYPIPALPNTTHFVVESSDGTNRSGGCVIPKLTSTPSGYTQTRTNVTFGTATPHGLNVGDSVFVNFTAAGAPADGLYQVTAVQNSTHFSIVVGLNVSQTQNGQTIYPLVPPPLNRSGTVAVQYGTWAVSSTDSSLYQTPLNSPTVFNFFFPDYKFPGALTTAGLTTPEFQLTADTSVAQQMNFLYNGFLNGNSGNTNGFSSFNNGSGALVLDIGRWMTPAFTSNANIPTLVDNLNSLLCAGQLSSGAKTIIVNYVANTSNFAYTTASPTLTQMRDRVRAAVHLILTSPDYTIQK